MRVLNMEAMLRRAAMRRELELRHQGILSNWPHWPIFTLSVLAADRERHLPIVTARLLEWAFARAECPPSSGSRRPWAHPSQKIPCFLLALPPLEGNAHHLPHEQSHRRQS